MNRPKTLTVAAMSLAMVSAMALLMAAITLPTGNAAGHQEAQDVARVEAASQLFIAAVSARDINAMGRLWAHDPDVTFMGPLSTTIVVGWDGVRKAWEMRFGQFDRVAISLTESHVRSNGKV